MFAVRSRAPDIHLFAQSAVQFNYDYGLMNACVVDLRLMPLHLNPSRVHSNLKAYTNFRGLLDKIAILYELCAGDRHSRQSG